MSPDDKTPKDGAPTIDSLLKGSNWEERLAEARVKREKVLAARNGAPKGQTEPQTKAEPQIKTEPQIKSGPQIEAERVFKIKVKDKPAPPPLRAIRTQRKPPARPRLRLRWIFLGIGVAACLTGAFMLWTR